MGFGLALARLPGVNSTGLSSSVNDDQYIDIRGLGASETVALLDGHPVGPIGVYGINGGGSYPYVVQLRRHADLRLEQSAGHVRVGRERIVRRRRDRRHRRHADDQPQRQTAVQFAEGIGNQGGQQTAAVATGTAGKIQYAAAYGVNGTYGMFSPGLVAQTGRPNNSANLNNGGECTSGNDISACNIEAQHVHRSARTPSSRAASRSCGYNLSNNTNFTATVYSAASKPTRPGTATTTTSPTTPGSRRSRPTRPTARSRPIAAAPSRATPSSSTPPATRRARRPPTGRRHHPARTAAAPIATAAPT